MMEKRSNDNMAMVDGGKQENEDVEFGKDDLHALQYKSLLHFVFTSLTTLSIDDAVDVTDEDDVMVSFLCFLCCVFDLAMKKPHNKTFFSISHFLLHIRHVTCTVSAIVK